MNPISQANTVLCLNSRDREAPKDPTATPRVQRSGILPKPQKYVKNNGPKTQITTIKAIMLHTFGGSARPLKGRGRGDLALGWHILVG